MASLVLVDCKSGQLLRVEIGGTKCRKTHIATPNDGPTALTAAMIENFRVNPPDEFKIEPPNLPHPPAAILPRPRSA